MFRNKNKKLKQEAKAMENAKDELFLKFGIKVVPFNKITVPKSFQNHKPKKQKTIEKAEYFQQYGFTKEKILVDENYKLVDGYTAYLEEYDPFDLEHEVLVYMTVDY